MSKRKENVLIVTDKKGTIGAELTIKDDEFGWQDAASYIGVALGSELKDAHPDINAEDFLGVFAYYFRMGGRDPIMFDPTLMTK